MKPMAEEYAESIQSEGFLYSVNVMKKRALFGMYKYQRYDETLYTDVITI
jgi:hypothetical protein